MDDAMVLISNLLQIESFYEDIIEYDFQYSFNEKQVDHNFFI